VSELRELLEPPFMLSYTPRDSVDHRSRVKNAFGEECTGGEECRDTASG